jgi:enoyl-CoA hydratase/carnithine racemase
MEVRWGLIPDMAGTQLLPELVGRDVAKDLTFTGRKVSGSEAAGMGLVTRLADDPVAAAVQLAQQIAAHDRNALRHAKALLDMAGRVPLADGLDAEQRAIKELLASPAIAAIAADRLQQMRGT